MSSVVNHVSRGFRKSVKEDTMICARRALLIIGEEISMYTLFVVGYVLFNGSASPPVTVSAGSFADRAACEAALHTFDPAVDFRDVTKSMNEYRWGLLCAPSGVGVRSVQSSQ